MSAGVDPVIAFVVVALDYLALSWFPALASLTGRPEAAFRVGAVLFIGMNAGLLLAGRAAPRASRVPAWPAGALGSRAARGIVFVALAGAAVAYRLSAIARTPLDPTPADMLPLISAAGHNLLAGVNPYRIYTLPTHSAVIPWLPALWLPYVIALWAGVDLRLVGLLAVLLAASLLAVVPWSPPDEPARDEPLAAWLRLGLAGGLLLAPAAVWFGAIGHTQTYWLYLVALAWALSRRSWALAGVCLGLCVMSRHTVLPLLPVVALYAWRCLPASARRRLAASAAVVVLVLALPFGPQGLWQFVIGSPLWYAKFGDLGWNGPRWWITHTFGLGTFFYPVGLGRALPWIGAALLLLVYALAGRAVRDLGSCVRYLALTLLVVTVSVPTPFRYELFPIVLLVSALPLVARPGAASRTGARP